MEGGRTSLTIFVALVFYFLFSFDESSVCAQNLALCPSNEYRCIDKIKCIPDYAFCNGFFDCDDQSDERYCPHYDECPDSHGFYRCKTRCIPPSWRCDGYTDCPNNEDEQNCSYNITALKKSQENMKIFQAEAISWLQDRQNRHGIRRWGSQVHRIAVALYLANARYSDSIKSDLAYEVSLELLSRMALKKMNEIPSSQLALFVNAFLVTCIDPRNFHVVDLIAEIRQRVNAQKYTNPFILLTLCKAGENIYEKDIEKLVNTFWNERTEFWTDVQAYVVMALVCAASQPNPKYNISQISALTMELKKKQNANGIVDNFKTTALMMQAIFASEEKNNDEDFDREKALKQLLSQQLNDGSFGSIVNTYYVLPVLNYKSLVNINSNHCPNIHADEEKGLKDLMNQVDDKWHVQLALWIGDQKDLQRTLKLRVPANTSLYTLMEVASKVDVQFKFRINVKNGKPYIYELSGLQNDPERNAFWSPYIIVQENGLTTEDPIKKSPADFIPINNEQVVYWYKTSSWEEN